MNILHLSTFDTGGAGTAALRLHQSFLAAGHRSKIAVRKKKSTDSSVFEAGRTGSGAGISTMLSKVWLKLATDQDYYFQSQDSSVLVALEEMTRHLDFQPDAIIVHWVSNFVSAADLRVLGAAFDAPIIWYLLDMAPLTGGCHYAWNCTGYYYECGMCPALYSIKAFDRSHQIWAEKLQALQGVDLAIAAGSGWLERQAAMSSLFRDRPIRKILLAVDPDVFRPVPKAAARKALGLPEDRPVIFFGNQGLGLKRKGMSHLVEALRQLSLDSDFQRSGALVAVAGEPPRDFRLPVDHVCLGFLRSDKDLACAYQAADVFVCPSVEDSGPMMINESIMCGTPVVSFDMGVAPDLVLTGSTGYRGRLGDASDLARGIKFILAFTPEEKHVMALKCRELGLQLCGPERQLNAFLSLMQKRRNR